MSNPITEFRGEYSFLSNFHRSKFEFEGKIYPSAEHAFQAQKTLSESDRERIRAVASPTVAKRLGRTVELRSNWDQMKIAIMFAVLKAKFRDPKLQEKLLATGNRELIEGNYWGDTFWGVCGFGENHLGKLLMKLREECHKRL